MIGRFRPWVWFAAVCLVSCSYGFLVDLWGDRLDLVLVDRVTLPSVLIFPVLLGCVGGYYRNWWVSIGGVPAMLLALHIGGFASSYAQTGLPPPLLSQPYDDPQVLVLWSMMLVAAVGAHAVARPRFHRFPPGHCQRCGYDLRGSPGPCCPECGEPI
ncbi:MAG: hypothetical protein ACYSVY_10660, partial [Planctomycetota bacterium]|jgi:hypothetical protein